MSSRTGLHPEMQVLLQARGSWPSEMTVVQARAAWAAYTKRLWQPAPASLEITNVVISSPEGGVPVRRYSLVSSQSPAVILYMHGGGFMKGSLDDSDAIAWGLAVGTGVEVWSIDYRLAPEHPYPAAFDDCYAVLTAASEELVPGNGPRPIVVLGDSAGGNLAAALCLASRDRGGPAIAAQVQIYPGHGGDPTRGSYLEHADGPLLTRTAVCQTMSDYTSGELYAGHAYAQPLRATDYSQLPPAWIHTAEIDPIRDDGREYAARLVSAGVDVSFREAKGMLHGFLRARFAGPASSGEFEAVCRYVRNVLEESSDHGGAIAPRV